jgi:hypothetical protein
MAALRLDDALVSPAVHADEARIHELFGSLRRRTGLAWVEPAGYRPFWAVTRHAEVMEVSRANDLFINSRRLNLMPVAHEESVKRAAGPFGRMYRTIAHMDDPDHREYRRVTRDWFMGSAVKRLEPRLDALAGEFVARMESAGGEIDFATEIANWYPLRVIMAILGVPREDQGFMLRLTQQFFGADDPDLGRSIETPDQRFALLQEFFDYFTRMAADRRRAPQDDLATVIALGQVRGRAMGDLETASYYAIVATAGHDTTAFSTAGGMLALLENPRLWERLKEAPELLESAVEEMLRWVSPVRHFVRTAAADHPLGGSTVRKGESVVLFYPSANRDEAVFDSPFVFDIARKPNRHLAFGFGGHMCLGLFLARLEMRVLFRALLARVRSIELAGAVQRTHANLVGGIKSMPVRYRME